MRIIGGKFGGFRIKVKIPDGTRPTTDRHKEQMFNVLNNYIDFENIICADLFAGSGGLGIEAISRGASYCSFVDKSQRSISTISSILKQLDIDKSIYNIYKKDVVKYLNNENKRFDLIFIDPPYKIGLSNNVINLIETNSMLKPEGIIVSEHGWNEALAVPDSMQIIKTKQSGDTVVDFISLK